MGAMPVGCYKQMSTIKEGVIISPGKNFEFGIAVGEF